MRSWVRRRTSASPAPRLGAARRVRRRPSRPSPAAGRRIPQHRSGAASGTHRCLQCGSCPGRRAPRRHHRPFLDRHRREAPGRAVSQLRPPRRPHRPQRLHRRQGARRRYPQHAPAVFVHGTGCSAPLPGRSPRRRRRRRRGRSPTECSPGYSAPRRTPPAPAPPPRTPPRVQGGRPPWTPRPCTGVGSCGRGTCPHQGRRRCLCRSGARRCPAPCSKCCMAAAQFTTRPRRRI
mmetsp:Transcript_61663/g.177482  ORF Transcript_61663/g.177482 Transcript_61663/m.177482 type:complete len:234 (+) Transcript_61663:1080-1781(+)